MSLEQFVHEALTQNLSLKASEASALAEQEGAYGIAIPPPQAGISRMQMAMGNRSGSGGGTGITVSQSFPFPTKITSEHGARKAAALAKREQYNSRKAELMAESKFLYFRLWEASAQVKLFEEKRRIVERHIRLARAIARSDNFLKIHVIKAESDRDLLMNLITQAEQNVRERQIEAATFLDRNPDQYRPIASEFAPSPIPEANALVMPHQLQEIKQEVLILKAKESEARSKWFPDLNFEYKNMGATPALPQYTQITVGLSLPFIFFWERQAENGKASAKRLEAEYLLDKEKRHIESEQEIYLTRAQSLKKQLDQFSNELLPRAEKRVKLVNNLAPRDMETLQDQRETLEAFPDLKLKVLEIREQYEQSVAELEKFRSGERE